MTHSLFIDIQDIRIGMYVQLEMGWLRHPFPVSSFRINNQSQIEALQSLGLQEIRCIPAKSDPEFWDDLPSFTNKEEGGVQVTEASSSSDRALSPRVEGDGQDTGAPALSEAEGSTEVAALMTCNERFSAAARGYRQVEKRLASSEPAQAMQISTDLVAGYIAELLDSSSTVIRLLSESVGEQQGAHSVNVTVLSLLLGKSYGLGAERLQDLGLAALLHDVGKIDIDPRSAEALPTLTDVQRAQYEEHVGASVTYAQRMGLSPGALTAIAQHHEAADGLGFPLHLLKEDLSIEGQILAITNCYDKLCNPLVQTPAMTPHEALSVLFAQRRGGFAREIVELFVRVMGVYPPGSVVQLSDERYGMVVSVDGDRPLKPSLLLYSAEVERMSMQPVDLSDLLGVVIKRSLRPAQLPREVLDYLSPRKRVCYFFERAVPLLAEVGAA